VNAFATLFAKDLREQRLPLLAVLGLGLLGTLAAALFLPPVHLDSPVFVQVLTAALGSLAALAIGCDLGNRERCEGSLGWLLRQPFGALPVVLSKFAVLALGVGLGVGLGLALGGALSAGLGQGLALSDNAGDGLWFLLRRLLVGLPLLLSLGLWSVAASSFLPRGFLAAPAGGLLFLICTLPAAVPLLWYEVLPERAVSVTLVAGLFAGGIFAAVAGLTAGLRVADRPLRRALRVSLAGGVACLPLWVAAAEQTADLLRFDPTAESFAIEEAFLAADGRHALLEVFEEQRDWRGRAADLRPILVDLDTGAWRTIGPRQSRLRAGDSEGRSFVLELLDGQEMLLDGQGHELATADLESAAAPPPSTEGAPLPDSLRFLGYAGAGWRVGYESGGLYGFFDPRTGDLFSLPDLQAMGLANSYWTAFGTRGPWILSRARTGPRATHERWLFEPRERRLTQPQWLLDLEAIGGVLRDGNLLVLDSGELRSLDPRSGESTSLAVEGRPSLRFGLLHGRVGGEVPLETDRLPAVLVATSADGDLGWLSLTEAADEPPTLRWVPRRTHSERVVGQRDAHCLAVVADGHLWSVDFDSGTTERLFPR
jgi:ABC-type transport system involved in multi-copper enzyme maturation permease subunit